jgi:hypothetical protein
MLLALLVPLACDIPDGMPPVASSPNTMDTASPRTERAAAEALPPGAAPTVRAKLPKGVKAGDVIQATVSADGPKGAFMSVDYAWTVNDRRVGTDSDRLPAKWFNKGDTVVLTVTATADGKTTTQRSNPTVIENTPPTIDLNPKDFTHIDGFTIPASDADGDPLTFTLQDAPDGLTITTDGTLSFRGSKRQQAGHFDVKIVVTDTSDAAVTWPLTLDLEPGQQDVIRTRGTQQEVVVEDTGS